jgi:hypothetical protein
MPQPSYPQPGYQQPGQPQPGYGYAQQPQGFPQPQGYGGAAQYGYAMPREHPQGTTILVLGICSLVICGLFGPFAWNMGNKAIKEMDAQPGVTFSNRGTVNGGRICGIIGTVLMGLGIAALVLIMVVGAIGAAA